jgi:hypothetical protein
MVLIEWETGDTITKRDINNRSIRKGTESEIAAIAVADRENGDHFWNSTTGCPQVQCDDTNDGRGNIFTGFDSDSTVVTVTGATATQVKNVDVLVDDYGIKGNQITVVAEIKTDNNGTVGTLRVRLDSGGTDALTLTTQSLNYEVKSGTIDVGPGSVADWPASPGRHTIEFWMDDGAGDIISNRNLEVFYI